MDSIEYSVQKKSQVLKYIYYTIAILILTIVHLTIVNLISFFELTPDLLLIICVWIALHEGRFKAMFWGFAIGFFFDIVSFDVIGTNALAKTIVCFVAGSFYKEGKESEIIGSYNFILLVLLCSVVNNIIYSIFYIQPSQIGLFAFFFRYGLLSAFYTTVISIFVMVWKMPRKKIYNTY